jgi:hypothetical protein
MSQNISPEVIAANISDLPILQKTTEAYKLWQEYMVNLPRLSRFTLGKRIDDTFTELIELLLLAGYAAKNQKFSIVARASTKLDVLKFFLQVAWMIKALGAKKYVTLSAPLNEVGKMLGGWRKQLAQSAAENK